MKTIQTKAGRWLSALAVLALLGACSETTGEVVDSAYIEPLLLEPEYRFSRNEGSSVETSECRFLSAPINYVYDRGLKEARMGSEHEYQLIRARYLEGEYGLKPREEVAGSRFAEPLRERAQGYLDELIDRSATIGGRGSDDTHSHRRREALKGQSGYVGKNIGDKSIYFVDGKGFDVAEIWRYAIMGAVYLDKILNVHLAETTLTDRALQTAHEAVVLPPGRNYTALEHQWDLAYGYYAYLRPLAQSEGLPALRDSEDRLRRAFVMGRTLLETFRYGELLAEARTIRAELARVLVIRAMHLLAGDNTRANLREEPRYAFRFISMACGLVYALQFAPTDSGEALLSPSEAEALLGSLAEGDGLWESERLLSGAEVEGSLSHIAQRLGALVGVGLEDIQK